MVDGLDGALAHLAKYSSHHSDAIITTDTEAWLGQSSVLTTTGAVTVAATNIFFTTMIAGAVGVGGTAGIGAANSTLVLNTTVLATIGSSANVTAGTGLSVEASESDDILAIVAGVAVGGTAGVAGSATVNVLTETTTADIGDLARINVTAGDLDVAADDASSVISVAGDLAAGGTAGVGVGVDVGVYTKHTNAYIGDAVNAAVSGNIEVTAQSAEDLISVAAGVAVSGTAAVGVNAGVHVFTLQTRAFIGDDPLAPLNLGPGNVLAGGDVVIAANDASNINEIVGVLALIIAALNFWESHREHEAQARREAVQRGR